jgi:hypothetical protein
MPSRGMSEPAAGVCGEVVGGQARGNAVAAGSRARLDELRGLLQTPRARAELAESMGLSPSRVTVLLEQLARTGDVREIRDPDRPSRKLWALAEPPDGSTGQPGTASPPVDAADVEGSPGSSDGDGEGTHANGDGDPDGPSAPSEATEGAVC